MRKDRNTFFTNYNAQQASYIPDMPNMQVMPNNINSNGFGPYQAASTNSSFYAGPDIGASNDLDNRLSKIERQINRLDNRVSKLENNMLSSNTPIENIENNYSNMYML